MLDFQVCVYSTFLIESIFFSPNDCTIFSPLLAIEKLFYICANTLSYQASVFGNLGGGVKRYPPRVCSHSFIY